MEYLSPVLSTGYDKESSESPALSTEFIKPYIIIITLCIIVSYPIKFQITLVLLLV